MSGIAAIVQRDGGRPAADALRRMLEASPYRAHDGSASWSGAGVALGFLAFHTLPDTHIEPQPLVCARRRLAIVFDGRIDNRDELCASLDLPAPDTLSDVRIVLEAVARWGADAAERLIGDFGFAAWQAGERRLVCARDHMGIRPLHYYEGGGFTLCATDVCQILADPRVPREPDAATAADALSNDESNDPPSLYRGIMRVPPGHALVVDDRGARLRGYWRPEPRGVLRYRRDADYAEHCRELMARAVGARLRGARPAAALLSGGVDSSSVVATGLRVLRHPNGPHPFSIVFPDEPVSDERPFIDAISAHCGVPSVCAEPPEMKADSFHRQSRQWLDVPGFPADDWTRPAYVDMTARGHRMALSGGGADFLFTGSIFQCADLLRELRPLAAWRRLVEDSRGDRLDRAGVRLLKAGLWPLLPVTMKRTLRPLARRAVGVQNDPPWLLVRRRERPGYPERPRGGSHATEETVRLMESGGLTVSLLAAERTAAEHAIEVRFPFMDVRLVEFGLSIPDEQRCRGPYAKYVVRQALAGDLPDAVRYRTSKGDFSPIALELFEALGGERFFGDLHIARAGWVKPDGPLATYRLMRAGVSGGIDVYGAHIPEMWSVAMVEIWFRAAFTV